MRLGVTQAKQVIVRAENVKLVKADGNQTHTRFFKFT